MVESIDNGEEIIGRAGNANDEINVTSSGIKKNYCGNCKKNIHSIHGTKKKGGPVVMFKDRCNNKECECKCLTHFIGEDGHLRKLDTVDDSIAKMRAEDHKPLPPLEWYEKYKETKDVSVIPG